MGWPWPTSGSGPSGAASFGPRRRSHRLPVLGVANYACGRQSGCGLAGDQNLPPQTSHRCRLTAAASFGPRRRSHRLPVLGVANYACGRQSGCGLAGDQNLPPQTSHRCRLTAAASFGPRRRSRPFAVLDAAGLRLRGQRGLRPCRRPKSTALNGSQVPIHDNGRWGLPSGYGGARPEG